MRSHSRIPRLPGGASRGGCRAKSDESLRAGLADSGGYGLAERRMGTQDPKAMAAGDASG